MCGKPSAAHSGGVPWGTGHYQPHGDSSIPMDVIDVPSPKTLPTNLSNVKFEDLSHMTFEDAYAYIVEADQEVAPGVPQGWADVKSGIDQATTQFREELEAWQECNDQGSDAWYGATHDAAIRNLKASYATIDKISQGADTLHKLTGIFSNAIRNTRDAIVPNYAAYTASMADPHNRSVTKCIFDRYAQSVLTNIYAPNIAAANDQPDFPAAAPNVGKPPAAPPSHPTAPAPHPGSPGGPPIGGGNPPGVGGGGRGGGGGPAGGPHPILTPKFPTPTPHTTPQSLGGQAYSVDPSTATASPTSGLQNLSDLANPLQSLSSPLQSALGQAMNAAQQAGKPGALGGPQTLGKLPPEGALKGIKGGAGAGGGAGLRGASLGKPAGAPANAAGSTAGRTVAAGARAGLSGAGTGGMGAPGAGAPAAGHQAGGAGGPHQPSKALRRKKNGEEIIGDAEAVVAVLGEPARPEAAKPPNPT